MSDLATKQTPNVQARLREIRTIEGTQGAAAAESALVKLLQQEPNTPEVLTAIARFMCRQKRFSEAEKAVQRAISLAPLNANIVVLAGLIQIRLRDRARAAQRFADAIRLDPESAPAHLGLAAVQMLDEDYETALRFCDRAIDLDPSIQRAYELVARINVRRGNKDLAIAELKSILDENPEAERVAKAYVRLLRSEGRSNEALTFLEEDLAREPANRTTVNRLARLAIHEGKPAIAVRHFRRLIEEGSPTRMDLFRFVAALIENGEVEEAESRINALTARPPTKPIALVLRGDLARKTGSYDEAIGHYREASATGGSVDLPPSGVAGKQPADEPAAIWRKHAITRIRTAFRERANDRRMAAAGGSASLPGSGPIHSSRRLPKEPRSTT